MKYESKLFYRLVVVVVSAFLLSACEVEVVELTQEEAVRVMEQDSDFPKEKTIEISAKVREREWSTAYNKTSSLRKFVSAGLMELKAPEVNDPFYQITPTEKGVVFLLNGGQIETGGDFGQGFYVARLATEHYTKVNKVAEMIRFNGPPPSIELQITDVHFDISLSDVTPFGSLIGLKNGQIEKGQTGLLWKKDHWEYMKK